MSTRIYPNRYCTVFHLEIYPQQYQVPYYLHKKTSTSKHKFDISTYGRMSHSNSLRFDSSLHSSQMIGALNCI